MAQWTRTRRSAGRWDTLYRRSFGAGLVMDRHEADVPENAIIGGQNIALEGHQAVKRKGYRGRFEDILSDTWTTNLATPDVQWANTSAHGGLVYARPESGTYRDIIAYNISTNTWDKTLTAAPHIWLGGTVYDGDIYCPRWDSPYSVLIYDITLDSWSTGANPEDSSSDPVWWFFPVTVGTNIYARQDLSPYTVLIYDPALDSWSTGTAPSGAWIPIGVNGTDIICRDEAAGAVWTYDTVLDSWDETGTGYSSAWTGAGVYDGKMYAQESGTNKVIIYDIATDTWDDTTGSSPGGLWIAPVIHGESIWARQNDSPYNMWRYTLERTLSEIPVSGVHPFYKTDGTSQLVFGAGDSLYYDEPFEITEYETEADWQEGETDPSLSLSESPGDIAMNEDDNNNVEEMSGSSYVRKQEDESIGYSFTPKHDVLVKEVTVHTSSTEANAVYMKIWRNHDQAEMASEYAPNVLSTVTFAISPAVLLTAGVEYVVGVYAHTVDTTKNYMLYKVEDDPTFYISFDETYLEFGEGRRGTPLGAFPDTAWTTAGGKSYIPHIEVKSVAASGDWISPTLDLSDVTDKSTGRLIGDYTVEDDAEVNLYTRESSDGSTWGAWLAIDSDGTINHSTQDYLQWRMALSREAVAEQPLFSSAVLYYDGGSDPTLIDDTLTATGVWYFATYLDQVILTNGVDVMQKWDGSALADLGGSPPVSQYVALVPGAEYLFAAGNSTYPTRLYYSDQGDPETWPALAYIEIGQEDGDAITGLFPYNDYLVIFKERSIHVLYGRIADDFSVRNMTKEVGCVAPKSIALVNGVLMFLSYDGVYAFDGTPNVQKVSTLVDPLLRTYNERASNKAAAITWQDMYWLALPGPGAASNSRVVVYDAVNRRWFTEYVGLDVADWCIWSPFEEPLLIGGNAEATQLMECDDGYMDGNHAITSVLETRHEDFDNMDSRKHFAEFGLFVEGQTSAQTVGVVLVNDYEESDSANYTASASLKKMQRLKVYPNNQDVNFGRVIGLKLTNSGLQAFRCSGYAIEYRRDARDG